MMVLPDHERGTEMKTCTTCGKRHRNTDTDLCTLHWNLQKTAALRARMTSPASQAALAQYLGR